MVQAFNSRLVKEFTKEREKEIIKADYISAFFIENFLNSVFKTLKVVLIKLNILEKVRIHM